MRLLTRLSFIVLLMTLVACGGSGDSLTREGDTGTTPTTGVTILSLSISNVNVTEQTPATITANLTKDGVAMSGEVVTFTTSLGVFDPAIGTALTDANGNANIILNAGDVSGAGVVRGGVASGEDDTIGFTTEAVSAVVVRLGNGSGASFSDGALGISLAQVSAGGTTVISTTIVDEQGNLYTEPVNITFSSRCTSETTPSASLSTPVTTSNGIATSTYLAKGCVGDDVITANAIVGSSNLSATGTVNVLAADIGSIIFQSATPEHIAILGTGGDESSTVIFKVLDVNGNPINDQEVAFELSTEVGGIVLSPLTATTNANGEVQTVVNSGTVSTSIRVKATIVGSDPAISSQSKLLVLSTGIPDQDSFSLSATIVNPEGWDVDGTEVSITARLADAFNNPAPDDTAVSFTTEGGSIDSFCVTINGACTVTWRSQLPRPIGKELQDEGAVPETVNTMGQKYGGRATILATAIGEESFPDTNGNGRFDESEMAAFAGNDISGQPYDLKEAFVDHNEDGFYNPGETDVAEQAGGDLEEFSDFNNDNSFTVNDGLYNGVLCSEPVHAGCSTTQQSINVRASLVLIMSGSTPEVLSLTPAITLVGESSDIVTIVISDLHNQPMPAGTTVTFSTTAGSLSSASSFTWPNDNHNGGRQYSVAIKGEADPTTGIVFVEIATPSGVVSSLQVATVDIQ